MQTQPDLPYDRTDQFEAMIKSKDISAHAQTFLMLMFGAANGDAFAHVFGGVEELPEPIFWMETTEDQKYLASLCGFGSDATIRRICVELQALDVLVRETEPIESGGKRTTYYLALRRVFALPDFDPNSPAARIRNRLRSGNPFDKREVSVGSSVGLSVGSSVVCRSAVGELSFHHAHAHDHEHDINKTHDHEHDHDDHEFFESVGFESQESQFEETGERQGVSPPISVPAASPKSATAAAHSVSFSAISDEHAKRIVRQLDSELFAAYFADAVNAGWARDCLDDRTRMAGLFHQVLRIGKAIIIGATIASAWKQRDNPGKRKGKPIALKLSAEDQDFAAKLIHTGERQDVSPPIVRQIVKPLRTPLDGEDTGLCLSAAEIQRQQEFQRRNIAALRSRDLAAT